MKWNVLNLQKKNSAFCDGTERLLHSMFQVLVDFVEIECAIMYRRSYNSSKWEKILRVLGCEKRNAKQGVRYLRQMECNECLNAFDKSHAWAMSRIVFLYWWWTEYRIPVENICNTSFLSLEKENKMINKLERRDQKFLEQLLKLRYYMWT